MECSSVSKCPTSKHVHVIEESLYKKRTIADNRALQKKLLKKYTNSPGPKGIDISNNVLEGNKNHLSVKVIII